MRDAQRPSANSVRTHSLNTSGLEEVFLQVTSEPSVAGGEAEEAGVDVRGRRRRARRNR